MNIQPRNGAGSRPDSTDAGVNFPQGRRKEESPVYARNDLFIPAPADRVWACLIRAGRWHEWYGNVKNVQIEGGGQDLAPGARFHWTTSGVRVHTTVDQFVPNHSLTWSGTALGCSAYHGWIIRAVPGGCLVVTEETQQGIIPFLARGFLSRGLLKWHQRWLEGLAEMAAGTHAV